MKVWDERSSCPHPVAWCSHRWLWGLGPAARDLMAELWFCHVSPARQSAPRKLRQGQGGSTQQGPDGKVTSWFFKANTLSFPSTSIAFNMKPSGTPSHCLHIGLVLLNYLLCQHPGIPSRDYLPALLTWMSSIYSHFPGSSGPSLATQNTTLPLAQGHFQRQLQG